MGACSVRCMSMHEAEGRVKKAARERPILMSGPLVVATMKGLKRQTRRLMNPQPAIETTLVEWNTAELAFVPWKWSSGGSYAGGGRTGKPFVCPLGVSGDRLWVRETFYCDHIDAGDYRDVGIVGEPRPREVLEAEWRELMFFRADGDDIAFEGGTGTWKPSIHMPRWASRLTLEITDVRAQRLQDISEEEARAEGVAPFFERFPEIGSDQCITSGERAIDAPYRASFAVLWDEINGDREVGGKPALWKANPFVWVISYRMAS